MISSDLSTFLVLQHYIYVMAQPFQGLDYVIVEARRHKIRLILSLVNNLNAFGGKAQYVRWAKEAGFNVSSSNDSFFSNAFIKNYYKAYVKAIVTRRNSLSGVKYSEEPAIFAWELINEPRCESSSSAPALENWITEMAAYVKSLDNKHLLTVGLEGFYGFKTTEKSTVNPGKWAASLGSDFIQNSAIENIDFASVHAYPHSWIPLSDLDAKAGFVLGPSGISNIEAMKKFFFQAFATDYYETMAMYARIIIMFLIGLEFDVPYLRQNFKRAFTIALGGCVTCTIFCFRNHQLYI